MSHTFSVQVQWQTTNNGGKQPRPFFILRGVLDGVGSLALFSVGASDEAPVGASDEATVGASDEAPVGASDEAPVAPENSLSHSRKIGRSRSSRVRVVTHLGQILSDFFVSGVTVRPIF